MARPGPATAACRCSSGTSAQLGHVAADVGAVGVELLRLGDRVEDPEVGRGVGAAAGHPLPVQLVLGDVAVAQVGHEPVRAVPPADVQVLDQERGHHHPHPVVHPALGLQLPHPGVDQRVAGPALLPGRQPLRGGLRLVRLVGRHLGELGPDRLRSPRPAGGTGCRRRSPARRSAGPARSAALGAERGQVGQHRPRVQMAPAQRDRQVRGRVRTGEVVQLVVVARPPRCPGFSHACQACRAGFSPARSASSGSGSVDRDRSSALSQSTALARTPGAGSCTPWSSQARWNGLNTWKGSPEPLVRVPGATAYGEPVRRSSIPELAERLLAPRRPGPGRTGAKSALTCTVPAPHGPGDPRHGVRRLAAHHAESGTTGLGQVGVRARAARPAARPCGRAAPSGAAPGPGRRAEARPRPRRSPPAERGCRPAGSHVGPTTRAGSVGRPSSNLAS